MRKETFKGYILEELLAFLIRNTGYRLLVHPQQDPQELGWERGRLVVKGRGTVHQADVLGELNWIPAFTWDARLCVPTESPRTFVGHLVRHGLIPRAAIRNGRPLKMNLESGYSSPGGVFILLSRASAAPNRADKLATP